MIKPCFHPIEFNRITPINDQKRFQIQLLITIHITKNTPKDLKLPKMTSKRPQTNQFKIKKRIERWLLT